MVAQERLTNIKNEVVDLVHLDPLRKTELLSEKESVAIELFGRGFQEEEVILWNLLQDSHMETVPKHEQALQLLLVS